LTCAPTRTNTSLQIKGCFRHTNTLFPAVLHTPSKESQSSTLVLTNPLNQKMEHCLIKWENLSFPTDWVIDTPRVPIPRAITSAQIKETSNSTVISFPQRNLTKQASCAKPHSSSSFPSSSFCLYASLQSLANQVGQIHFTVKFFDSGELITLSTLSAFKENEKVQFEHANHNPRTNLPPPSSTAKDQCPHPQCSDIPFPHDSHVLVIKDSSCTKIDQRRQSYLPEDMKRPSYPEIKKFLLLLKGCRKDIVKAEWMKEMLNWDLFTHPKSKSFANNSSNTKKLSLSLEWKKIMDSKELFISFYEWNSFYKRSREAYLKPLVPQKTESICYILWLGEDVCTVLHSFVVAMYFYIHLFICQEKLDNLLI
jgi:hypothetical protein